MCAGKTLTGRALAALLKRPFCDSDQAVEKETGIKIAALFSKKGPDGFRRAEAAAVKKIAARCGVVAALGGGIYPSRKWKNRLAASGTAVYLHCPWPELRGRLKADRAARPLLAGEWGDACGRARTLYRKRLGFYRLSDLEVNTSGLSPQAVAGKIKAMLPAEEK